MTNRLPILVYLVVFAIHSTLQAQGATPEVLARERIAQAEAAAATNLDLSALGLTEVPPEIGQLSNLDTLDLSNNQLRTLPAEIALLTALNSLDVSNNNLEDLPIELGRNFGLAIYVEGNPLSSFPPYAVREDGYVVLDYLRTQLGEQQRLTAVPNPPNYPVLSPQEILVQEVTQLRTQRTTLILFALGGLLIGAIFAWRHYEVGKNLTGRVVMFLALLAITLLSGFTNLWVYLLESNDRSLAFAAVSLFAAFGAALNVRREILARRS